MRRFLGISCFLLLFSTLFSVSSVAVVDIYEFDTASQRERYHQLSEELRCPKCQNQNLAGSDSQIAGDLRRELHRLLLEGKTDHEIKTYMVERYGEFVLYKPRLQKATFVLWVLPVVLFFAGIFLLNVIVNRRRAKSVEQGAENDELNPLSAESKVESSLSAKEQSELEKLLATQSSSEESKS